MFIKVRDWRYPWTRLCCNLLANVNISNGINSFIKFIAFILELK